MKKLLQLLETYGLKSLKVTSLVVKRKGGEIAFMPDCKFDRFEIQAFRIFSLEPSASNRLTRIPAFKGVGFDIPDHFIVGHNFDYNENFRDLSVSPFAG